MGFNDKPTRPLRILSVIETLGRGGAEIALLNLLVALKARDHECELSVLFPPYDLKAEFEARGIRVHQLALSHRWNLIQGVTRLGRVIRNGKFDVVHAHLFFAGFYAAMTRMLLLKPIRVVSFHNLGYESYPANTLWRRWRKAMDAMLMRNCVDGRVGVSIAVARHYRHYLRLDDVEVIPNVISIERVIRDATMTISALLSQCGLYGKDYIIMPGRLVPEKGHLVALHALSHLKRHGVCPCLIILGSGPQEVMIQRQIHEMDLEGQVRLLPPMVQSELFPLIEKARFVLQSSTHEGFSIITAEAQALGVPVVATRVGAIPEIVVDGETGLLVDPDDDKALAEAIAKMWQHPEWRNKMGSAGRQRMKSRFSRENIALCWESYYLKLITRNTGSPNAIC